MINSANSFRRARSASNTERSIGSVVELKDRGAIGLSNVYIPAAAPLFNLF